MYTYMGPYTRERNVHTVHLYVHTAHLHAHNKGTCTILTTNACLFSLMSSSAIGNPDNDRTIGEIRVWLGDSV